MKNVARSWRLLRVFCALACASFCARAQQPTILTQPQGSTNIQGAGFTLSVYAVVPGATPSLPSVSSGNLIVWLKADAGVVTNSAGQVSIWHDQSGMGNDVSQSTVSQAPTLTNATMLAGLRPTLRFNQGPNLPVNGQYLHCPSNLDLTAGYTSFFLYTCSDVSPNATAPAMVGVYNQYYSVRASYLQSGQLGFSAWADDFPSTLTIAQGTYRIWANRLHGDLSENDIFDCYGTNTFSVAQSVSGLASPGAGYYIGGLNDSIRSFPGDFSEVLYYSGALSDADRVAVTSYLQQKYFQPGATNGLSYQWRFNNATIPGATNATLTLADLQVTNSGSYSVVVSNSSGVVSSSNAVLFVAVPPNITSQPTSQEVIQGTNVTFSVGTDGTGPVSYQWLFDSTPIVGATNSTLTLTNVLIANVGQYSALLTSPYGSDQSSPAFLAVDAYPVIGTQPQNQYGVVGGSVTFRVGSGAFPSVTSAPLKVWLKADAGVVVNSGQVSLWRDQSGNGLDVAQPTSAQQPTFIYANYPSGTHPALSFNGLNPGGDYLFSATNYGLSNGYTSFLVYSSQYVGPQALVFTTVGTPEVKRNVRASYLQGGELGFSAWSDDYLSSLTITSNSLRILTDRLNDSWTTNEIYDYDGATTAYTSQNIGGLSTPGAGFYIAGLGDAIRSLACEVSEVIYFSGALSESDRLAVTSYLQQKYYGDATAGLAYQWQFDGTNIAGATNVTLTLTNLQLANVGTYTVIASNLAGVVASSNATLTLGIAPLITNQPASQSVPAGLTASLSVGAAGTGPNAFQWTFDGASIANATNSSLTLTNVTTNMSGIYAVTVTSPFGSAISSNAVLTVFVPTVQAADVSAGGGTLVTVPVLLEADGLEAGVGFSVDYKSNIFTFVSASLGSNAQGSLLLVNTNQTPSGRVGIAIDLISPLSPGTNDLVDVTFQVAVLTNATTNLVTFGGQPTAQEISDAHGSPLLSVYVPGTITTTPAELEGDVWPVSAGDGLVTISDWVQEGRFVAGLDTITNASELLRADCAPRSTGGDGQIDVADWVQVGRYAAGLDPLTAVGYPPGQNSVHGAPMKTSGGHAVTIVPMTQGALTNAVAIQLAAQGNENSVGFSLSFDPAAVRFLNATLGSGATGAVLFQNTAQAAAGQLGFVLGYNLQGTPTTFATGLDQLLRLNFASVSYSNNVALTFNDAPVVRDLVDVNAASLSATFQNGSLPVAGAPWPPLSAAQANGKINLSWPISSGFVLESAPSVAGPWAPVVTPPATNGADLNFTAPATSGQAFYRLQQQ